MKVYLADTRHPDFNALVRLHRFPMPGKNCHCCHPTPLKVDGGHTTLTQIQRHRRRKTNNFHLLVDKITIDANLYPSWQSMSVSNHAKPDIGYLINDPILAF
jgi:hypothetical protein